MGSRRGRRSVGRAVCIALLAVSAGVPAAAQIASPEPTPEAEPFPVHERLSYAVNWMGIHCGEMEIVSFVDDADGRPIYRIVVLMRTTRFFDGIYRVRSRLDSFFDPRLMSSIRYEERSLEKKKSKEEIWTVDGEAGVVLRDKNGTVTEIPIEVESAYDPLAFVLRLRSLASEVGDEQILGLMTSKGAVETVVTAAERRRVRTKMGRCDAVGMVPQPQDEMMFSKSGAMTVWIDVEDPHRPCRIEFDLSFGKLVASLRSHAVADAGDVVEDWQHWGEK